jgi:hypothetical protein
MKQLMMPECSAMSSIVAFLVDPVNVSPRFCRVVLENGLGFPGVESSSGPIRDGRPSWSI